MKQTKSAATASRVKGTYGTMYYVKDMAKSVKFFSERLGARPSFESPEWAEFRFGGQGLCLHLAGIKQFAAELKAAGTAVGEIHEVPPGAYAADFKDVDGNVVGLYEGPVGG